MPTYEYECKKCRRVFEVFQNIADQPLRRCPECKSKIRRLIGGGAGIIFKGSGFYQTDYRSEHYRKQAAAEKKSAAPDAAAETKKSAAKKDKNASSEKQVK
jgi:putative FmdB family regulatory protein